MRLTARPLSNAALLASKSLLHKLGPGPLALGLCPVSALLAPLLCICRHTLKICTHSTSRCLHAQTEVQQVNQTDPIFKLWINFRLGRNHRYIKPTRYPRKGTFALFMCTTEQFAWQEADLMACKQSVLKCVGGCFSQRPALGRHMPCHELASELT